MKQQTVIFISKGEQASSTRTGAQLFPAAARPWLGTPASHGRQVIRQPEWPYCRQRHARMRLSCSDAHPDGCMAGACGVPVNGWYSISTTPSSFRAAAVSRNARHALDESSNTVITSGRATVTWRTRPCASTATCRCCRRPSRSSAIRRCLKSRATQRCWSGSAAVQQENT